MKRKIVLSFVLIIVVLSLGLSLFACNKNEESFGSIYVQEKSIQPYSTSELIFKVKKGWQIDTRKDDKSDTGYIESLNAFILVQSPHEGNEIPSDATRSIQIIGEDDLLFDSTQDIKQIRVKGDLIAVKSSNSAFVYNIKLGKFAVGKRTFKPYAPYSSTNIDDIVKILDNNTIAINTQFDAKNVDGINSEYTSIFRPTYSGNKDTRGRLVAHVKNEKKSLKTVLGFDSRYISIEDKLSDSSNVNCIRLFNVVAHKKDYLNDGDKIVQKKSDSDFEYEATYIGAGRFYLYENWSTTGDTYEYSIGDKRYKTKREIFCLDTMTSNEIKDNNIIAGLTNKYYGADKIGFDTKSFLQGNKMYASKCLTIDSKKKASYDQFLLDDNMNIIYSLSGNFGRDLTNLKDGDVSMFELILDYVDGFGYAPIGAGVLNIYDNNGNLIYEYKDKNEVSRNYPVLTAQLNNGVLVVEKKIKESKRSGLVRVTDGKQLAEYKYDFILPFITEITIAKMPNEGIIAIGKGGEEVMDVNGNPLLKDIAHAKGVNKWGREEVFAVGCYMATTKDKDGNNMYGIKKLTKDPKDSIIIPFKKAPSCSLYPYDARTTFVMYKMPLTDSKYSYEVYKLK